MKKNNRARGALGTADAIFCSSRAMAGEVPTVTTAKSSVAQSYVRAATSAATVGNSAESELEALRGGSGVAELTKKLTVKAHRFSKTAEEAIKGKCGTVEVIG